MRRPLAAALCAALLALAVVNCTGERATSPREPSARPSLDESPPPTVDAQINRLFPEGTLNSDAHQRVAAIHRFLASENQPAAGAEVSDFIAWMQNLEAQGALLDPNGYYEPPTRHQAVGILSASLIALVYPDQAPPYDLFDRDGAILVIGASGGGTIRSPSQHAAGEFPAGALAAGTIVTLHKIAQVDPGKGPLPTDAPQYGPFYNFEVFPDQHVQQNVLVAICQVTDPGSPFYAPEGVHDALRLAKPQHDDPSKLRVLEKVDPGTLIDCDDVRPGFAALDLPASSRGEAVLRLAGGMAAKALGVFLPTPAYAVHLGLGGRVAILDEEGFTPFGAVVPPSVGNQAPVANVGGPYTGRTEGRSFTYNASASSDADGDALTFHWDFGDGTTGVHGATPTHTYVDNGVYTVKVLVSDGRGGSDEDQILVSVANAPPEIRTVKLVAPTFNAPKAGQSWIVGWEWTDRGTADAPWSWSINWGDGSTTTGTKTSISDVSASHVYATPGTRTVTFRIVDKDGASATRSIPVNVQP